jgi:hypothetical protein
MADSVSSIDRGRVAAEGPKRPGHSTLWASCAPRCSAQRRAISNAGGGTALRNTTSCVDQACAASILRTQGGHESSRIWARATKLLILLVPQEGFEPPTPSLRMLATRRFLVREADSVQVVLSSLISPRVIRASCFCCPDPLTNFVHGARLSRSRNSPTPPGSPGACPGPWCADRSETPCCRPHGQGPVAQWYRHPWCR